jgi:hypothetical protein
VPKRSTRQSKSERGVVNERNVCSQERDKGRVDATRQRQQALFEERAHTVALNRRLAAGRTRDGEAHLAPAPGLRDARQRGRRGPLLKLRDAASRRGSCRARRRRAGCRADRKHQPYCPSGRW